MKKYKAKDEENLKKQIERDTELDKELKQKELVKGYVVEIRYIGKGSTKTKNVKKTENATV